MAFRKEIICICIWLCACDSKIKQKTSARMFFDSAQAITKNYEDSSQYLKAIALLEEAIKIDSNYFPAYSKRLFFEESMGKFNKATETLKRMIGLKPDSAELYLRNGIYYEISGDTIAAFQNYNRALPRYTIYLDTMNKDHPERLNTLKMLAINIIMLGHEKMLNDLFAESRKNDIDPILLFRDILGKTKKEILRPLRDKYNP